MPTSEIVPWLQGTNHFLFVFMAHMRCVILLPSTQRTAPALTLVYPWRLAPALYCRWRAFFLQTVTCTCLSVENKCLTVHRMSLWSPPRPREYAIWGWKIVGVREWRRIIFWKLYFLYMTWLLHSWTHSCYGFLNKTCTRLGPFLFHHGWGPTPLWGCFYS